MTFEKKPSRMLRTSLHRRTHAALLALATLAALLLMPANARAETYWLDGYEVTVTLIPVRESFMIGERIKLALIFENHSDTDIELLLSSSAGYGWPDDYDVRVTGPDGKLLPAPEGSEDGGDANSHPNLFVRAGSKSPNGVGSLYLTVPLKGWARPDRPGRYKVVLRRGVVAGPFKGTYGLSRETAKPATEIRLETEFALVSGGETRVGELIEELASKMLECDGNPSGSAAAAKRLAGIEDERAVGPLASAVAKCKNSGVKYPALLGLANFSTDAAFESLRAAAADADGNFRALVAMRVAENKHRGAWALLLSMRNDPYYDVRMAVLNALEHKDTEAARRLILEMTNDENQLVRKEALRFLQQRPEPSRK